MMNNKVINHSFSRIVNTTHDNISAAKSFRLLAGIFTLSLLMVSSHVARGQSSSQSGEMQPTKLNYPTAHRDTTVDTYFGAHVAAPYQWMENLDSPRLHEWVKKENKLTQSYLSTIPLRGWIQKHLKKVENHAKESSPERLADGTLFFRKNSGLQNQSVLYMQKSTSAPPRVLLNPNKLSKNGTIALTGSQPSPGGQYLAYELSEGGSDWRTVHVMNIETGKELAHKVHWVKFSGISWTHDGQGFFYSRYPKPAENKKISQKVVNQKLYYHKIGTPQSQDKLIYKRPDRPRWIIGGNVSEDGRYLFVYLNNGTAAQNELYYAALGNPEHPHINAQIKPLYTKNDAQYAPFGHKGDTLFVKTTRNAPRGKIVATRFHHPDPSDWQTVVPQGKGVIQGASMAGGKILVRRQVAAKSRLDLYSTDGQSLGKINLPTVGSVGGISARNDSPIIYYGFTSFLYPGSVYRYNVDTHKQTTFFQPKVAFDPSNYQTKQVFYRSKDGTKVPMFIVAGKDVKLDGKNPTLLYGYGGFNITLSPGFRTMLPVWLKLGGVYAQPNLRGGGAYGEKWHKAGMLGNKQNVFDDFAWAAKYLFNQGYTSSKHLGIEGYSNGGLLTGASITQQPDLFGAAYIGHGVLDMLRYQKFSGGALWAPEYGTSSKKEDFEGLYAYSPLHNIKKSVCFPPTLITTSWDDDRVVPSHEFKFAAKIQRAQLCDNPILLRTSGGTSHGYMPTDKQIIQSADVLSFMAHNLGITQAPAETGAR